LPDADRIIVHCSDEIDWHASNYIFDLDDLPHAFQTVFGASEGGTTGSDISFAMNQQVGGDETFTW
jgi:hypothetical protein